MASNPYKNTYQSYKGSGPPTTADPTQARGNDEYTYLTSKDPEQIKRLYARYGAKYGWMPLDQRLAANGAAGSPATVGSNISIESVAQVTPTNVKDGTDSAPNMSAIYSAMLPAAHGTPYVDMASGQTLQNSTPQQAGITPPAPTTTPGTVQNLGTGGNSAVGTILQSIPWDEINRISAQQSAANVEAGKQQALLNSVNTQGPFGSVQFAQGPNGQLTQTTTLAPEQQGLVDALMKSQYSNLDAQQQALNSMLGSIGRYNQYAQTSAPSDFSTDRRRIEEDLFNRQKTWLDQQYGQEQDALMQRLAQQGLDAGSEAYRTELNNFYTNKNKAYNDARYSAIAQGGSEQTNLANLQNQQRQQMYNEATGMLGNINTGMFSPQLPSAGQSPGVTISPTDVSGLYGGFANLAGSLSSNATDYELALKQIAAQLEAAKLNNDSAQQIAESNNENSLAALGLSGSNALTLGAQQFGFDSAMLAALTAPVGSSTTGGGSTTATLGSTSRPSGWSNTTNVKPKSYTNTASSKGSI